MKISYETATHMMQIITFTLARMTDFDVTTPEMQEIIDKLFNQYCDLMHINDIEPPTHTDSQLSIFFAENS